MEPGNLVALCRRCNGKKLELAPEDFYTTAELQQIQPLLEKQKQIFDFQLDVVRWQNDRETYLLDLGVDPELVHQILYDPQHLDFVGLPKNEPGIIISLEAPKV